MAKPYNHQLETNKTLIVAGVSGLVLAYALFTRAVDTGSLFQYGVMIVILVMSVHFLIRAFQLKKDGK